VGDGSDPRQQWARSILFKVLLPNLVLIAAAAFAVRWAVERALKPLLALKEAVERRSPRDLSAIDESASPEEVRPLVDSLNRLFGLVNAQAESQRRFVADAAHQLRTPLAGLQAQVEAWAQAGRAREHGTLALPTDQVYKLRSATRRTSQLANQLLALSRADARGMQSQPEQRVDLKALCEDILAAAPGRRHRPRHRPGPGRRAGAGDGPRLAAARTAVQPGGQRRQVQPRGRGGHHPLRPARQRAWPSWKSRTTARASRRRSCRGSWSASTGCRARWARATAWAWRSPRRSPGCTTATCNCSPAPAAVV
jgi:signal transduction histidine kinase